MGLVSMTSLLVAVTILGGATRWQSSQQQDIMRTELSDTQARVAMFEHQLQASPPLAPRLPLRGRKKGPLCASSLLSYSCS